MTTLKNYPIEDMKKTIANIMKELSDNPPQETPDPNMSIVYRWTKLLGPIHSLPQSLQGYANRAKFLDFVDKNIITGSELWEFNQQQIESFLMNMEEKSRSWIHDIDDGKQRVNITLRLWAGCWDAAKNLRDRYVSLHSDRTTSKEIITSEMRTKAFKETVDLEAALDPIYRAGVEVAPIVKRIRGESIFSNGISSDSAVTKFLEKDP
jgi:hypothetical protein